MTLTQLGRRKSRRSAGPWHRGRRRRHRATATDTHPAGAAVDRSGWRCRPPAQCAVAGGTGLLLSSPDPGDGDQAIADWYRDDANQRKMNLAVNLLTVSSIRFVLGGACGRGQAFGTVPDAGTVAMTQAGALTMASIVETRREAVFIISTTTIGRLSEVLPRWLVLAGCAVGLTLLLMPAPNVLLTWAFPIWVAIVSMILLVRRGEISKPVVG